MNRLKSFLEHMSKRLDGLPREEDAFLMPEGGGLLERFSLLGQWDDVAAEVGQESQARVAIAGLAGSGKSMLFNRLRGWDVSEPLCHRVGEDEFGVETYGAFVLADLPANGTEMGDGLLLALGEPTLVIYLLDGMSGVRPADFRWITCLRAANRPVVVVLNKCDQLTQIEAVVADAVHRLGMPVIPISAATGQNVETQLLPALLDAVPRLAVALGRELSALRRLAAQRIIRQAALLTGLLAAQPIPALDLPFQALIQCGVVLRVGAAYGRYPAGGVTRELLASVSSSLALHYVAQTIVKLFPLLGWLASAALGAGATLLLGEAAIRYYSRQSHATY